MAMPWWSRLRALVAKGLGIGEDAAADDDDDDDAPQAAIYGVIEDWNPRTALGLLSLEDDAELGFGGEACQGFTPILGIKVQVLSTGLPPSEFTDGPGLWATRLMLRPGTEPEYAARLRIQQVQRAIKIGSETAPATAGTDEHRAAPADPGPTPGPIEEPPWARARLKPGRKPAGPPRPQDAYYVLTIALSRELPADGTALSRIFDSDYVRKPLLRLIPLIKKGKPEPGFSAEVQLGNRRAFLVYRPEPYGPTASDGAPLGVGHIGLFVGGPHSPRVAAELGVAVNPGPLSDDGEVRLLSDLARSLLRWDKDAKGLVVNRARKAWKPRDIAQSQLGDSDTGRVPFVLWIDWNLGEREREPVMQSSGMESLGLPDVAVALENDQGGDSAIDRARDVLLYICRELSIGALRLPPSIAEPPRAKARPSSQAQSQSQSQSRSQAQPAEPIELAVPRRLRLLPASELLIESDPSRRSPDDVETYVLSERDELCALFRRKPEPDASDPPDPQAEEAPDPAADPSEEGSGSPGSPA